MRKSQLSDFLQKHITYEKGMRKEMPSPLNKKNIKYGHPLKLQNTYSEKELLIQEEIESYYQKPGFSHLFKHEKISFFVSEPSYGVSHRHPYIELMYIYAGHCTQELNGNRIEFHQGDLCLLDTSVLQQCLMASKDSIIVNCALWRPLFDHHFFGRFNVEDPLAHFFKNAYYNLQSSEQFIVFRSSDDRIKWFIENALCEYFDKTYYAEENVQHYLLLLLAELSLRYERSSHWGVTDSSTENQFLKVIRHVQKNYRHITLEEVARHFNYSPSYLGRRIKSESGMAFHQLVQNERLAEAIHLLERTDMSVDEIVNAIGYSNMTYFYKIFREAYGMSPRCYRQEKGI
ncbi:AraC family transcriptional regulator [Paenibacillus barcinonensis]|uniref:AraC family transcriptional regulator n=1 Tax=Paenibacillus barcinonensis TaxID=198119 RepID=UPI001C128979|nr:AraC family transcriptional regulator [Paenibacillus barcinonensis]MBU5351909.1 AraC family transcriptional regulator [Paenibacillus barcinonensis]